MSYDRRLDAWREAVFERIRALEGRGVSVKDLANDDAFLDALAQATRTAETQSSEEKRRYLADALFSIGAGTTVGPDKQAVYLRYVEELTVSHMRMLAFLNDPPGYLAAQDIPWPDITGGLGALVQLALPDLYSDSSLLHTVLGGSPSVWAGGQPWTEHDDDRQRPSRPRGTDKGRESMRFITREDAE